MRLGAIKIHVTDILVFFFFFFVQTFQVSRQIEQDNMRNDKKRKEPPATPVKPRSRQQPIPSTTGSE